MFRVRNQEQEHSIMLCAVLQAQAVLAELTQQSEGLQQEVQETQAALATEQQQSQELRSQLQARDQSVQGVQGSFGEIDSAS